MVEAMVSPLSKSSGDGDSSSDDEADEYGFVISKGKVIISEVSGREQSKEQKVLTRRSKKWAIMLKDWERWEKKRHAKLKSRIRKGVPKDHRGVAWPLLIGATTLHKQNPGVYQRLVATSLAQQTQDEISRDLARTFPTNVNFAQKNGQGQHCLKNLLHAYAVYDSKVGYCQGMGFVSATLLIHMAEEEAFWTLVAMMTHHDMQSLYMPGFPLLKLLFYQLTMLLEHYTPDLAQHLVENGAVADFYASQWFMTLFVYTFPMQTVTRVWDVFLAEGWKIIFRVAISLMKWEQEKLCRMPLEELLPALRTLHEGKSTKEIMKRALKVPIKTKDLEALKRQYLSEQGEAIEEERRQMELKQKQKEEAAALKAAAQAAQSE